MMKKDVLKTAMAYSVILFFITVVCSVRISSQGSMLPNDKESASVTEIPRPSYSPLATGEHDEHSYTILPVSIWDAISGVKGSTVSTEFSENMIIVPKSEFLTGEEEVELVDLAVDRQIKLVITGITSEEFCFGNIYRVMTENLFDAPILAPTLTPTPTPKPEASPTSAAMPTEVPNEENDEHYNETDHDTIEEVIITNDPVQSRIVSYTEEEDGTYKAVLTLHLNNTFAYKLLEDEAYYYICLLRPKDVYEKIVVIDAGHGGLDSGTYSKGYEHLEKDVNLSVLLYMKEFFDQNEDIKVYYTRTTDRRLTLNQRVNLANDLEADFFLSIHCNSNPDKRVNGTEMLYNELQNSWEGMNSKNFALICQEEAVKSIGLSNRGIVKRSHNVHIIGEAKMPVALIETGFMTNDKDLAVLVNKKNHKLLAEGLYTAILRAYDELQD